MKLKISKQGTTIYNFDDKPQFYPTEFYHLFIHKSLFNQITIYAR